jgi:ligand-binding sensor domain-containing protein
MYVPHGDDTLVLDLSELAPAGTLPPVCIHTLDAEAGHIYALAGRDLVVFSERGNWLEPPPTGPAGPLPEDPLSTGQVLSIQPSPDYARDQTLFLTTSSGKLYRSTDGGHTWAQLRGGLPGGDYLRLDLVISPDFATDRTLFASGFRREFWGEGVYRSTDGGDTWQPMWKDLAHLRVHQVVLSPDYTADGTLLAYSNYQRIKPWKSGASVSRSTDRGLSWTQVLTRSQAADLPPPEQLLPAAPTVASIQFRGADYGQNLERSMDGSRTWEPLAVTGQPEFYIQSIQQSPSFAVDHTVYVMTEFDLFRSTDGGQNWEQWEDERLVGRDYTNKLATATTSPALPDGRHQLFVGTHAGEFWKLHPEELAWEPVHIAAQWPTVLEGEWVGEIETSPTGNVWLGTWGSGLAHQAGGAIQAHYTVTDGLPTQYIGAIAAAPGGMVWAGGDLPSGVASLDGDVWTDHSLPGEDAVGAVYDISVGPDGVIWAGAQAPGLLRWTGREWELIPDQEGLTGWRINDVEIDDEGLVWAATARGLVFYGPQGWSGDGGMEATAVELGPEDTAHLLLSDASVWRYAGGRWSKLPPLQEGQALRAVALHADVDGAVWIGTHAGAFRYDGRSWRQFTAQDGLPSNDVAAINQDGDGWLWFGTSDGAARVDPETLDLSPVSWPAPPTPTPRAGPTPVPRAQPTPTACSIPPVEFFAKVHREVPIADKLHCPIAGATSTEAAYQPFEYGLMFWRADEKAVYVLQADGTWARYIDTWDSTQPPADPALTPPEGLLQPVRGFGKVWREQLGGPGAGVGWALVEEKGYEMQTQPFVGGLAFVGPWSEVYLLYADSTWESVE